jgi:hypothetical protein
VLSYDMHPDAVRREPHGDLLRQAYLLTGDPQRARELADRADIAGEVHAVRYGPVEGLEYAKAELVRSFVADPGQPPRFAPGGPTPHPDVAVWQAVCRLSPRRRAAIVLRYDEGLPEDHAASRLGTSPNMLRADVDAAMLTLRTALPGVSDPWNRVADALSAAGRGWSDYTRPAGARVAQVLASPAPNPGPRPAHSIESAGRSMRPVALAAALAAVVLLAAMLVLPRLGGDDAPTDSVAAAGVLPQQGQERSAPRLTVPTVDVPKGLLNWPARGRLATDPALLPAATKAWKAGVTAAEAPATGVSVLWAGTLDGRTVSVLQALDAAGRPHLAQVAGRTTGSVNLQHAEPLHGGMQVLTLLPPKPSGPVRVLVSPEGQLADGLLASNPMDGKPMTPTAVGRDGVSGILPSPPGVPTCSRVVLLGLDPAYPQPSGSRVLYSGIMTADMFAGMPAEVEVGSAALAPSRDAQPDTQWFTDGAKLASKVPGKGTLTVAALGPRLASRPVSDADKRLVSSRAYELRRGSGHYVAAVVDVAGKTVCRTVLPVGSPAPSAWALRCPLPGEMMPGIVHVVAVPNTQSVDVVLNPTKSPAGQERFTVAAVRSEDHQPADQAFAALQVAHMGFPCGVGTLQVHHGGTVSTVPVPVYLP